MSGQTQLQAPRVFKVEQFYCVVQVKDFKGEIQKESDDDPSVAYDGPLMVLTSRFSASASEILAGVGNDECQYPAE